MYTYTLFAVVFIGSILSSCLAHNILIPMANAGRLSARFWLVVDYAWLSIGLFAVLAAAIEIERLHNRQDIENINNSLVNEYRMIHFSISSSAFYTKNKWFIQLDKILEFGSQNDKWEHFLYQNQGMFHLVQGVVPSPEDEFEKLEPSDYLYKDARDIVLRLSDFKLAHDRLNAMKQQELASESVLEFLRYALITVFIIMFGLRITRATIDYKSHH